MPIYEYECSKCGHIYEIFQKISDKPLTQCQNCAGSLHKLISQSAFHLKGSGWYVTDYAKCSGGVSSSTATTAPSKSSEDKKTDTASAKTDKQVSE